MKDPKKLRKKRDRVRELKRLRREGLTWEEIGKRFGITRQAASQAVKRAAG